jgi:hypothetical protein
MIFIASGRREKGRGKYYHPVVRLHWWQRLSMLGVRVLSATTVTTRYFQTDNLGSITVNTDESGNVVERGILHSFTRVIVLNFLYFKRVVR